MIAVLKESGNVPSVMQRLIQVVIGRRGSIQDLKSFVGIRSMEYDELEKERMAVRTSSRVANGKFDRIGEGKVVKK